MTASILNKFQGRPDSIAGSPVKSLTARELEVFQLIGQGFKRSEIAHMLTLSVKTIGTHHESIKKKMNLKSATELTKYAVTWVQTTQ